MMKHQLLIFLFLTINIVPTFGQSKLLGIDKYTHAVTCSAGTSILTNAFTVVFPQIKDPGLLAAGTMFAVGVGKEIYDINKTGFDGKDIGANLVGCGLTYLLNRFINNRVAKSKIKKSFKLVALNTQ